MQGGLYCHRWPVRAVERYIGPWNKSLSNKIIIIVDEGNKADPITPLKSAQRVAAALGDSAVLVEQDSWGHTSLAMHSTYTLNILKAYFLKNKHPSAGKICGTDVPIFPGLTTSMLTSLLNTKLISPNSESNDTGIQLLYHQFFISIGPFSYAAGLIFVWTIVSWAIWRRVRCGRPGGYTLRGELDKEQQPLYATK
ncbi:hypothetical protein FRC12_003672 [Ceratobasidium sp. 428]|nr:hypothetical protein FRC12_003672 [Ceratobasidium sp. 428]